MSRIPGIPTLSPKLKRYLFGIWGAFYAPHVLQLLISPRKFVTDCFVATDHDNAWFRAVLFQCRLQGVFACGLVAFVLLFAMRSEEPRLVSWMIVLVTAVQAGVVITLTSEQFAEAGLPKPWHGNVVYAHIAMLMILLVALVLLL